MATDVVSIRVKQAWVGVVVDLIALSLGDEGWVSGNIVCRAGSGIFLITWDYF